MYNAIRLSELPIGKLTDVIVVISVTGKRGNITNVEFNRELWITVTWEDGTNSINTAEMFSEVYAMVYVHINHENQIKVVKQFNVY